MKRVKKFIFLCFKAFDITFFSYKRIQTDEAQSRAIINKMFFMFIIDTHKRFLLLKINSLQL